MNNLFKHIFNMELLISLSLVLPAYIIFFVSKEPIVQGIAYSLYIIPLSVYILKKQYVHLSLKVFLTWLFFLLLWVTPSLINRLSNKLGSDLILLDVLFVHIVFLSCIILTFIIYFKKNDIFSYDKLIKLLHLLLIPFVLAIFIKTIFLVIFNEERPFPFSVHPNVTAEIIFIFFLCSLKLSNHLFRFINIILCILLFYLLECRSAIIGSYIFLLIYFVFSLPHKTKTLIYIILFLTFFITYLYFSENISFLMKFFMLDIRFDGIGGRYFMWKLAIESIIDNPILGIGFFVNPTIYSIPDYFPIFLNLDLKDPILVTHNAFLRIASENGLCLFAFIIFFIIKAILNSIIEKKYYELSIVISLLFFLFFSTRHLTLNLLNIFLYLTIIYLIISKKQ